MVTATLYIEGGGDSSREQRTRFRKGWNKFFCSAGVGSKTKIVRGSGRRQTFDRFVAAVSKNTPNTIPFLLVDSEDPVMPGHSTWEHLNSRDGWTRPEGAGEDQAFLMVQIMETWFLADRGALRNYFGAEFRERVLRDWPDLEDVSKQRILEALERATASCRKHYSKGVSFELLALIDPARVEAACPHAKALFDRVRAL